MKNAKNLTLSWVIPCIIPFACVGLGIVLYFALYDPFVLIPFMIASPVFGCTGFCRMAKRYNMFMNKAQGILEESKNRA